MQKIVESQEYVEDSEAPRTQTRSVVTESAEPRSVVAARVVWFIGGVIIALLAIRFVLILLGANASSIFVNLIYTLSYPFAVPFFGIFNYNLQYGVSRFELSTLIAILVYALIAYGIARLVTIRRADRVE